MNIIAQLGLLAVLLYSAVNPGALNGQPAKQPTVHTVKLQDPAPAPVKQAGAVEPVVEAKSALLLDLPSGQVLFSKDADTPRPIASLAKLMTALVAVEHTKSEDVVPVGKLTNTPDESLAGFPEGEALRADDMLAGLLITSGNDAARSLAVHVSGTEEKFVNEMNSRAKELGLTHTHFASASGYDRANQGETSSSARDLAVLSRAAVAQPRISGVVSLKELTVTGASGTQYKLATTDALLGSYLPVAGLKTGTSDDAGPCLITELSSGNRQLLAIVLNSPNRFQENKAMLDWSLHAYKW
jgi:D-alanyl-D-alanine carboxypeptidase (penicillin-binding protein 5/6)